MSEEIKFGEREKNPKIQESMQKVLDSNTAFIAPYAPAKISTTKALAATVDIPEELGIEDAINEISPIDVQTERNGKMYSVNAMVRSFNNLKKSKKYFAIPILFKRLERYGLVKRDEKRIKNSANKKRNGH